jgi:hypothetical protein
MLQLTTLPLAWEIADLSSLKSNCNLDTGRKLKETFAAVLEPIGISGHDEVPNRMDVF